MNLSGNTIFIARATSGIARGLAERFANAGNRVIIAGRRQHLETGSSSPTTRPRSKVRMARARAAEIGSGHGRRVDRHAT